MSWNKFPGNRSIRLSKFSLLVFTLSVSQCASSQEIGFNQSVKPILSDRCFVCHGPDEKQRASDVRFDRREGLIQVVNPGDPNSSELIRRIETDDESERMPPSHAKISLTKEEIALIRKWVSEGAQWEPHWAFAPLRAPDQRSPDQRSPDQRSPDQRSPDQLQLNAVGQVVSPIDRFLLAKLEQQGLSFSPPASPATLLRRVTFDLTGVSPTLDELDHFLKDHSAQAYEQQIDRLLASPRFGERMATVWLDLARYSDTYGDQVDRERFVWPWRDWVIRSFNANLPFDQFALEQVAGDLGPNPSPDQILATTFSRLHSQRVEGGSIEEEYRVEHVADRAQTFATAFLGLTLECARCHDHKFDPISMDEYYQLFSFFNQIDEAGLYSYFDSEAVPPPTLMLLDEAQREQLTELVTQVADAEAKLAEMASGMDGAGENIELRFSDWLEELDSRRLLGKEALAEYAHKQKFKRESIGENQLGQSDKGVAMVTLNGDDELIVEGGNFPREQPFSVFARIRIPSTRDGQPIDRNVVCHCSKAWTDSASRGYQLLIEDGKFSAALIHFWPGNALCVKTTERIPTDRWIDVALAYDGSSSARGLKIYLNGELQSVEIVRDQLTRSILGNGTDGLKIGARFRDRGFKDGQLAAFDFFDRELSPLEIAQLSDQQSLTLALDNRREQLTDDQLNQLREYFVARFDEPVNEARTRLLRARQALNSFVDQRNEIMVMRETPGLRKTYRLARGSYDAPENEVQPSTPSMLPALTVEGNRLPNRLDLARWLIRKDNPLTARVAVNQYWQMLFGSGLVRTPEDFGSQSAPPIHAELLDWLAADFQRDWDVKRCIKQIAMSATYRQSSTASAEMLERDPENLYFARQSAFRLSAEMLRDHVLFQSGLLVEQIGGPPVRPYDLELAFSPIQPDQGNSLYRRSLYTFWKRTSTSPAMVVLDAPSRDVCTVRRERTSSPLQGLLLLNGTQFVEAARKLSEKIVSQHKQDQAATARDLVASELVARELVARELVARDLFRSLTSRAPTNEELAIVQGLFHRQLKRYAKNPDLAEELLGTGDSSSDPANRAELAAWTTVASTIMNFEESAFRR